MNLYEIIKEFIRKSRYCVGLKAEIVRNMIFKNEIFQKEMGEDLYSDKPAFESYKCAVKESVKSYKSNKDSIISMYKKLTDEINKKTDWNFNTDFFPPIPIANTFERLMFISKYLQNPNNKWSDLEDILWVSPRTLEADLKKLRGNDEDPLQVCGKKFIIDDIERKSGKISFVSTAHPMFLTLNITQVISILKGLEIMEKNKAFEIYAFSTAQNIWAQLSEYAKNRIVYVTDELLGENSDWYKKLENGDDKLFLNEYMCGRTEGAGVLLDCLKNKKSCFIEYTEGEKSKLLDVDKVLMYDIDKKEIRIMTKNEEKVIEIDKVIRSSYSRDTLY